MRTLIGSKLCLDEAMQHRRCINILLRVCTEACLFDNRNIKRLPCLHSLLLNTLTEFGRTRKFV